jgi:hypothetical protein
VYFFPVGVPGLFRQYNAPADFVETANTIGLPRYAKQAVDQQFARWVMHVSSSEASREDPLPSCPRTHPHWHWERWMCRRQCRSWSR